MQRQQCPSHKYVRIVQSKTNEPRLGCNYCPAEWVGGATRSRAHLLGGRPAAGVKACPAMQPSDPDCTVVDDDVAQLTAEQQAAIRAELLAYEAKTAKVKVKAKRMKVVAQAVSAASCETEAW